MGRERGEDSWGGRGWALMGRERGEDSWGRQADGLVVPVVVLKDVFIVAFALNIEPARTVGGGQGTWVGWG
eukprot:300367-Chlamydomonas_euryale.AAC.2